MAHIAYEDWKPGAAALAVVDQAEAICAEYQAQGYDLTLRQLYYQFVARDLIANTQKDYKRLGEIVNKGRLAGFIDWDYIVDRTRNLRSLAHWEGPSSIVDSCARQFRMDKWASQPVRVEVWVEKDALAGVVGQAADRQDVPWFACRGYVSQSELWGAAQRLFGYIQDGQRVVVLHLGDHDPSGIDMTRDIQARLSTFLINDWFRAEAHGQPWNGRNVLDDMSQRVGHDQPLEVRRIALNMDQVKRYNPPPNPAKLTDSRVEGYLARFGSKSWELDALEPATMDALITEHILAERDEAEWDQVREAEAVYKDDLAKAATHWDRVVEGLVDL